jgi:hypothetical protein
MAHTDYCLRCKNNKSGTPIFECRKCKTPFCEKCGADRFHDVCPKCSTDQAKRIGNIK